MSASTPGPRTSEPDRTEHELKRATPGEVQTLRFGCLIIQYDSTVLRPRPWTLAQALWGAEVLAALPETPILELCSGAGHIGLALAARTDRRVILTDSAAAACAHARANVEANGFADRVEVRRASIRQMAAGDERFALVLADPPWVPSAQTGRYPDDPLQAIDGGPDGLVLAYECAAAMSRLLLDGGMAIIQLGDVEQASMLEAHLQRSRQWGLRLTEVRRPRGNGVLAMITRRTVAGGVRLHAGANG